jgi:tetratricopeptide (TPR) repeat protein
MIRLLLDIFRRQFRAWDRPSQIGFLTGIVLVIVILIIALNVPQEQRGGALGAAAAVWLVTQLVVLWANRGMVTPYTRAQRHYLHEDFDAAADELEKLRVSGKADMKALTLLGNTYRQLGRLDESEAVLRSALEIAPNHHFPLYGFGRTLLMKGDYAGAVEAIGAAIEAGAPPPVAADLGEALYRAGDREAAVAALKTALPLVDEDPQRKLMVTYLLYETGGQPMPDRGTVNAGIAYWQALAERFRSTPYGSSLSQDVITLKQRIGEL